MPPTRGRELKHGMLRGSDDGGQDAPYAGARIETEKSEMHFRATTDAPYAGARIETDRVLLHCISYLMPPTRGRELKLVYYFS